MRHSDGTGGAGQLVTFELRHDPFATALAWPIPVGYATRTVAMSGQQIWMTISEIIDSELAYFA